MNRRKRRGSNATKKKMLCLQKLIKIASATLTNGYFKQLCNSHPHCFFRSHQPLGPSYSLRSVSKHITIFLTVVLSTHSWSHSWVYTWCSICAHARKGTSTPNVRMKRINKLMVSYKNKTHNRIKCFARLIRAIIACIHFYILCLTFFA